MIAQNLWAGQPAPHNRGVIPEEYALKARTIGIFQSVLNSSSDSLEPGAPEVAYEFNSSNNNSLEAINQLDKVSLLCKEPLAPADPLNKMAPVTDFQSVIVGRDVIITYIHYYPVFSKSRGYLASSPNILADTVNQKIIDSLTSPNWAYNQSGIRYSAIPTHQPNWFRPKVMVNGEDILKGTNSTFSGLDGFGVTNHKGAFSIGAALPFDCTPNFRVENFRDIVVFGQCYQAIDMSETETPNYHYQRIPLFAEIDFIIL